LFGVCASSGCGHSVPRRGFESFLVCQFELPIIGGIVNSYTTLFPAVTTSKSDANRHGGVGHWTGARVERPAKPTEARFCRHAQARPIGDVAIRSRPRSGLPSRSSRRRTHKATPPTCRVDTLLRWFGGRRCRHEAWSDRVLTVAWKLRLLVLPSR